MELPFIHLHVHSEFSLRDGLLRVPELIESARENDMPAVALTDFMNLFATVKFFQKGLAGKTKPIIGAEINLGLDDEVFSVVLLCQNKQGYRHLTSLLSRAYQSGYNPQGEPVVDWAWLKEENEGLIVLSGALKGDIGQAILAGKEEVASERVTRWASVFGDRFYLELQRTGHEHEAHYFDVVMRIAGEQSVPVVATNNVCFASREDFEAHEARICIQSGHMLDAANRPRHYTEQQYWRTSEEMRDLFSDIPESIENTYYIAQRCNFMLELGQTYLPEFSVPSGFTEASYLEKESHTALDTYFSTMRFSDENKQKYRDRLDYEISVINQMGFAGYFLIVADFIGWAKKNDIPVGPGRGSGAGSLAAFALKITTLDPIEHGLIFERFLNPERVSMPDFDIDFCMDQRDRVIDYVAKRYGAHAVSQIITYGTMAAKAVLRDVGRVLGYPYGFCDTIAKLIPFEIGMTLDKALEQEELLEQRYEKEAEVTTLIDLARKLEGIARNAGRHAGGVVIAPGRLTDFTPLYCEHNATTFVTQFDKDDIESIGLVKFDFLGLRTLTIIDWAIKAINKKRQMQGEPPVDIEHIPLDDLKTFELLRECNTTAVFQLESRGMKELVRRLEPDSFSEITALVALFRPGPLQSGMVDDFIDRKHGRAPVYYPHPDLELILQPTYGVILYQEQVMQIAQTLAGYTLGGADLLRRAMGKKKPEEMAKQRQVFMAGALKRDIDAKVAEYIFDLIEKFAGYGFNKSHSAAYALIAYQTAWLKSHFPSEFMAAVLSSDMDNTDKVVGFLGEARRMKLVVKPPNVNESCYRFSVNKQNEITYGLGAIKGVGEAALDSVLLDRDENGAFSDLFSFCVRVDLQKVNRRVLEALIRAGAMDVFGAHRASLIASVNPALQAAEQARRNAEVGQEDLFAAMADVVDDKPSVYYVDTDPWTDIVLLQGEKDVLGYYLTSHPLEFHQKELKQFTSSGIGELESHRKKNVTLAGLMVAKRLIMTKTGKRMAILTLEDHTGTIDVTVFNRLFEEVRELLNKDTILVVRGSVDEDKFTQKPRLVADSIQTLTEVRHERAKRLLIRMEANTTSPELLEALSKVLIPYQGGTCEVAITYSQEGVQSQLALGEKWRVQPDYGLLEALAEFCGKAAVELEY